MARTPYASPETAASPNDGDQAPLPTLEDAIIVVHENGYELIEADSPSDDAVEEFVDELPGDEPNTAAFNADAHPETSDVEMVDEMHGGVEAKETLQQAWLDAGRLDVLVRDDVIKCVDTAEDATGFIAIEDGETVHKDISDDDVVLYHEYHDYEAYHAFTVDEAREWLPGEHVDAEVVGRDELETLQEVA